jgi:hypothetical protein
VLWGLWQGGGPLALLHVLIALVGFATLVSGSTYVWLWSRRALEEGRNT